MQRRPVCAIEDLPPGSMKLVQAGKFGVGVYNIDGSLYAIANYCSHEGAPLCAGYVVRHHRIRARGRRARCDMCAKAASPDAHGITGSSTSPPGSNLADPQKRVRTYEVDVTDGQVYLTA